MFARRYCGSWASHEGMRARPPGGWKPVNACLGVPGQRA